ncbi:Cro/Cl family transcriptional regulator [Zooshikella ganghwensis]|uniref:Cro/Cl family transcriptional regulator n=2 Tax=Zooshikella ganghwensis TaxID=202772 RepID=A0A4P9VEF0_9GAMM|nr:Cro/Cl family transcriptional regulator [Zooshikella ganghwensis]
MHINQAVEYFGNKISIAKALGISSASISKWGEKVPKLRAYQLQVITNGALKADSLILQNTNTKGLIKNERTITG